VALYLPMVPELATAMLACARVGAPHSAVFSGFSAEALADRNNKAGSRLLVTADGGWRRGKVMPLKQNVDTALARSPITPEAWIWCHEVIGTRRCPIVDAWGRTETGMILIAPLLGATPTKPGSCARPFPGVVAEVVDKQGKPAPADQAGLLVIGQPWPAMLRAIYGDDERYRQQYGSQVPHAYFTADGARRDEDGYFWILARVDDVPGAW
jgi:acyl-coenzyme A synthetase/AMP-(fatty) acid ligase